MAVEIQDLDLVTRAADGDEIAFRALVIRHESAIARVVTAMIGSGDDADDVGQETFVRFFDSLPRFRGESEVRTYLTRIAVNLCCDVIDKRRRQSGWVRLNDVEEEPPSSAPDQHRSMEDAELSEQIKRAVDSLDAKHRAVVVMRILEERGTREVAEMLGVPEGTVMSRLKRALTKLETRLASELDQ